MGNLMCHIKSMDLVLEAKSSKEVLFLLPALDY